MRRREFVAGGIALAAGKAAFPAPSLAQPAPPRIDRIIDAHCHVFNAADLPIEGFARKVMVPRSAQTSDLVARFADYPGALEALVHAIAVQVRSAQPLTCKLKSTRSMSLKEIHGESRRALGARTGTASTCGVRFGSSGSAGMFLVIARCR